MKNITLICLNDFLRKQVSKEFANQNNMNFIDLDELVDAELLKKKQVSIRAGEAILSKIEIECFERVAKSENTVCSVSAELYMANDNRYYLENSSVVYLITDLHKISINEIKNKIEREKLIQQSEIQSYINDYLINICPFVVENADGKTIDELVEEIKSLNE